MNLVYTYLNVAYNITGTFSGAENASNSIRVESSQLLTQLAVIYKPGFGTFDFNFAGSELTNAGGVLSVTGAIFEAPGLTVKSFSGTLTGVPQATATAVPEPEAYAMMLAGLGLVGFAARRKQQAA